MATQVALERPLPHNLDAERSVLGAILLDNHVLNVAIEKLKPEDFFLEQHRRVFQQMIALGEAQHAIDLVTLTDELYRHGELEAAGGAAYLAQLVDGVPRITNLEHYARIVKEKALLRSLIHSTHAIQQQALEADEDADVILDRAESTIFQLAEERVRAGFIGVKELVRENFDRLARIFTEGKRIIGLPTGYQQAQVMLSRCCLPVGRAGMRLPPVKMRASRSKFSRTNSFTPMNPARTRSSANWKMVDSARSRITSASSSASSACCWMACVE